MTNLTEAQKKIAGSFSRIVHIFTAKSSEYELDLVTPSDMHDEIVAALSEDEESIFYARFLFDVDKDIEFTHFVFFPRAQRGGVCFGGDTRWTDATDMDDLEHRYRSIGTEWE